MRTAIFVYEPTTLTIHATENLDIIPYGNTESLSAPGQTTSLAVQPGVYKILSDRAVTIEYPKNASVEVLATDDPKGPFPQPTPQPPRFGIADTDMQSFFADLLRSFRP
jgi:hypothetical protein